MRRPSDTSAFQIMGWLEPFAGIVACVACMINSQRDGWHQIIALDLAQPVKCDGCGKELYYYEQEGKETVQ